MYHWSHDPNSASDKKLNTSWGDQLNSTSLQQILLRRTHSTRFSSSPLNFSFHSAIFWILFPFNHSTFHCISYENDITMLSATFSMKTYIYLCWKNAVQDYKTCFVKQSMWRNKRNEGIFDGLIGRILMEIMQNTKSLGINMSIQRAWDDRNPDTEIRTS